MTFGIGRGGGATPSNQDREDSAIIVRTDDNNSELLSNILLQLKIISAYNAQGHDEVITEDDLESR